MPAASWLMNLGFAGGTSVPDPDAVSVYHVVVGGSAKYHAIEGGDAKYHIVEGGDAYYHPVEGKE